jgi:hypothetical protein
MSNVMATGVKIRDAQWLQLLRLVGGLLFGFSFGVDVSRWYPQSAFLFRSLAVYSAIIIVLIIAFWQKRQSE